MGAVVSCIKSVFRAIGNALSGIIDGTARILKAIINGIANVLNVIISFLTCGRAGSRRSRLSNRASHHGRTARAI